MNEVTGFNLIKNHIHAQLPGILEKLNRIRKAHSDFIVSEISLDQLFNGLRGVTLQVSDIAHLDPEKGIRFRNYPIPELLLRLPMKQGGHFPLSGGVVFLLLTGELPTESQALSVEMEWQKSTELPENVRKVITAFPRGADPMTIFSAALLAMQNGVTPSEKNGDWDQYLEDGMRVIAGLPIIAAAIYNHLYQNGKELLVNPQMDWGGSFSGLIKNPSDPMYEDYCRLFFFLHADGEAGSVSANIARLSASAHANLYACCAAAMDGFSGRRQGHADQEDLEWLVVIHHHFKGVPKEEALARYLSEMIEAGRPLPGNGNGSLRIADPRIAIQLEYAAKCFPRNEMVQLARMVFEILPSMVLQTNRIKSSYPNLGAVDGVIHDCFGIRRPGFLPVLSGMSRLLGLIADIIWSRALDLPPVRTKPLTLPIIEEMIQADSIQDRSYGP